MLTDLWGTDHEVDAAIHPEWGRCVYIDEHPFTVDQAREIARHLMAAANTLSDTLIDLRGGRARTQSPTSNRRR